MRKQLVRNIAELSAILAKNDKIARADLQFMLKDAKQRKDREAQVYFESIFSYMKLVRSTDALVEAAADILAGVALVGLNVDYLLNWLPSVASEYLPFIAVDGMIKERRKDRDGNVYFKEVASWTPLKLAKAVRLAVTNKEEKTK